MTLVRKGLFCSQCACMQGLPASLEGCSRPPCWPGFERRPPRVQKIRNMHGKDFSDPRMGFCGSFSGIFSPPRSGCKDYRTMENRTHMTAFRTHRAGIVFANGGVCAPPQPPACLSRATGSLTEYRAIRTHKPYVRAFANHVSLLERMVQALCLQMAGAAHPRASYEHFQNPSYKHFPKPCKLAVRTIVPSTTEPI